MKLGIMQPYLFPYIGYFSLIHATDEWIVFDTPQFIRKGWINRNRVLKEAGEWKYLSIPVAKAPRETPIKNIEIKNSYNWQQDLINGLSFYKKIKAPYFSVVESLVIKSLNDHSSSLTQVIVRSLKEICDYLQIKFSYQLFSQMDLNIMEVNDPGEWALNICDALKASAYINPPSGKHLFDKEKFTAKGIDIFFLEHRLPPYEQKIDSFIPGLSIIDVLMFNSVSDTQKMLDDYLLQS